MAAEPNSDRLALRDVVSRSQDKPVDDSGERSELDQALAGSPAPAPAPAPESLPGMAPAPTNGLSPNALTPEHIAEKLGITVAEYYERAVVPQRDERPARKLGELKDLDTDSSRLQERSDKLDVDRVGVENAQLRLDAAREAWVKDGASSEVQGEYEQRWIDKAQGELDAFVRVVPGWADAKQKDSEIAAIRSLTEQYGLDDTWIASVAATNHVAFKLLRDVALRDQKLTQARESLDKSAPTKRQTTQPAARAAPDVASDSSIGGERNILNNLIG